MPTSHSAKGTTHSYQNSTSRSESPCSDKTLEARASSLAEELDQPQFSVSQDQDMSHLHDNWEGSEVSVRSQKLKDRVNSMFNIATDGKPQRHPRSKTLPRNAKLDHKGKGAPSPEDYASEIRSRSKEVKKELELERMRKRRLSRSPTQSSAKASKSHSPRTTLDEKVAALDDLTKTLRQAKNEKANILQEVEQLQNTLKKQQADMRLTEKLVHTNRVKAEDIQTDLNLAELRRDKTMRDLSGLNAQLDKKRSQLRDLEQRLQKRVYDLENLTSTGLPKSEIDTIIAERDELYLLLKDTEDTEMQRYELERQLSLAKDDLRLEQQRARDKIQGVEEELEASIRKITDLMQERDIMRAQMSTFERQVHFLEGEKDKSQKELKDLTGRYQEEIQRKLQEHAADRSQVFLELQRYEQQQFTKETQFQSQLAELKEILKVTREDLQTEQLRNTELRAQTKQLEFDLDASQKGRNEILIKTEYQLREKDLEKEKVLAEQRNDLTEERNRQLALARQEHEQQMKSAELRFQSELEDKESMLMAKLEENNFLKEKLHHEIVNMERERRQLRAQSQERLRQVLVDEKTNWMEEQKMKWSRELNFMRDETSQAVRAAEDALRAQRDRANQLEHTVNDLRTELEEEKRKNREATKEKIGAIRHLKEVAKEEIKKECDKLRSQQSRELKQLRDHLESEKSELEEERRNEAHYRKLLTNLQKTVVLQINDECMKIAQLLDVNPKIVNIMSKGEERSEDGESLIPSTNLITASLANLEACGDEVRALVEELKDDLLSAQKQNESQQKEHQKDLDVIKRELRAEHSKKVMQMRDQIMQENMKEVERLIKAPEQNMKALLADKDTQLEEYRENMDRWKQEMTEILAEKLHKEFRKEYEKRLAEMAGRLRVRDRLLQQHGMKSDTSPPRLSQTHSSVSPPRQLVLFHELQQRVRQLRAENEMLKNRRDARSLSPFKDNWQEYPENLHRPTAMERLEAKVNTARNEREGRSRHALWKKQLHENPKS